MYDPELARIAATLHYSSFPKKFAVEITSECNLACSMCHHPSMRRPKGRIPFLLWEKCADEIAAVAPQTEVWFSFIGEPLLEPDLLLRIVAYGKKAGLQSLNINSNGMPLTAGLAERIVASGVNLVVIGLDAFSAGTYARLRVNGDRDVVYANVERLLAICQAHGDGPEVQVQFIEMDENEHERDAFVAWWLERGAVVKVRNKLSWGGKFITPLCTPTEERIPCPWAMTMMHLFWDGRVPRCPGDTEGEESVGNAWEASLTTLWARLGAYRDKHMSRQFDELPERCQQCKDWMVGAAKRIRTAAGIPTEVTE